MPNYTGHLIAKNLHVAIVVSRFNETITKQLLEGALECFHRHGVEEKQITTAWVPGAFEIPLITQTLAQSKKFDAVVCLGAVIRGATPHFDYVCGPMSAGIAKIGLDCDLPIIFGVLTVDTIDQAMERSGTKMGNKGFDCALAAIEMVDLKRQLTKQR